jgi:hypothetical protein
LIKIVVLNQTITFDNKRISQTTGKKILLDVQANEPHDCPARMNGQQQSQQQSQQQRQPLQQQRRYHQCNKGCGQEIYFDTNTKTESGKWIPIYKDTQG